MEPRTTNHEGEVALVQAGQDVGVKVGFGVPEKTSSLQGVALMPKSGGELVQEFEPGIAGALVAGGFVLCMVSAILRRKR